MTIYYGIKYALSSGKIDAFEGRVSKGDPSYVYKGDNYNSYSIGRDAFESRDAAIEAAKAARDKKVKSLQKQIKKLEEMDFSKSGKLVQGAS